MYLKRIMAVACLLTIATEAMAQQGYRIICPKGADYCDVTPIPTSRGRMHWYSGVYVSGDGDWTVRADSRSSCQAVCARESSCVLAEFYFGPERRNPVCNLFTSMQQMKWNPQGDAQVGVWE